MSERIAPRRLVAVMAGLLAATGQVNAESGGPLLDPTRPRGWQASKPLQVKERNPSSDALRLQGLFSLAGERSAMISGRRVTVGDRVSGAEVVEINHDRVILRVAGEMVELASVLPDVKSPTQLQGDGK